MKKSPSPDMLGGVRFCSQRGLRIGPIQRMGAAPGVIHTERFFVLIPLEVVGKINGGKR
jgi:hypothetical protein